MGNRHDLEILRAAVDERLYAHLDCGEQHISYDNVDDDYYEGLLCTDEAVELIMARLLKPVGKKILITARGQARLARAGGHV